MTTSGIVGINETTTLSDTSFENRKSAVYDFMTSDKCNLQGLNVLNIINSSSGGVYTYLISGNGLKFFRAVNITYYDSSFGEIFTYANDQWLPRRYLNSSVYSSRELITQITTEGTTFTFSDLLKYRKIIVGLSASNIYNNKTEFDPGIIYNSLYPSHHTLYAGYMYSDQYYAWSVFWFNGQTMTVSKIVSPQANATISVYGIL